MYCSSETAYADLQILGRIAAVRSQLRRYAGNVAKGVSKCVSMAAHRPMKYLRFPDLRRLVNHRQLSVFLGTAGSSRNVNRYKKI